jgi:hypothetical protein
MADDLFGCFCSSATTGEPVYVTCPSCLHPAVIPRTSVGKYRACRQCYCLYLVKETTSMTARAEMWLPGPNLVHPAPESQRERRTEVVIRAVLDPQWRARSALAG